MRNTIKLENIQPGMKQFFWEGFCLRKDNERTRMYPDYDPRKLSPEGDQKDWAEFEEYYKQFENAG